MPIPVTLSEGDCTWDKTLAIRAVCKLIMHLLNGDYKVNEERVFPKLDIDKKKRKATDNVLVFNNRPVHFYRIYNKALAMELLSALLLTCLNSVTQVTSYCQTRNGLPHSYAGPGKSDITADYPATKPAPEFQVVAEVSIKQVVDVKFYRRQLMQAHKHALELAKKTDKGMVYALVINAGEIGSDLKLQRAYRKFMETDDIKQDKRVRVVPIFAGDLVEAVQTLRVKLLDDDRFHFGSATLAKIFDALQVGVLDTMPKNDDDWMYHTFVNIAGETLTFDV